MPGGSKSGFKRYRGPVFHATLSINVAKKS
jgi:hypothetical protein